MACWPTGHPASSESLLRGQQSSRFEGEFMLCCWLNYRDSWCRRYDELGLELQSSSTRSLMNRRDFLSVAAVGLSGCAHKANTSATVPKLMPIRASVDRIFRVTVCLRPFRAAGPRLRVERGVDKTLVHNYGHGGSGWSLSWGSSSIAVEEAIAPRQR